MRPTNPSKNALPTTSSTPNFESEPDRLYRYMWQRRDRGKQAAYAGLDRPLLREKRRMPLELLPSRPNALEPSACRVLVQEEYFSPVLIETAH